MITCVGDVAEPATNRGVKKADSAVPPMPAPKTPVAKPRRDGVYQALTNGMPTAKVVPAMPSRKPKTSSSVYEPQRAGEGDQQHGDDRDAAA